MSDLGPDLPGGRGVLDRTDDSVSPALTLRVEDEPTIQTGDVLLIYPDVGRSYRATVRAVEGERLKCSIPPDPKAPHPVGRQTRRFDRDELEAALVNGDLLINPPEQPGPDPRDPGPPFGAGPP